MNRDRGNPGESHICPGGDSCLNLQEILKLREEIKQLAAIVRTDELTGLFNFRYFSQALSLEMERTRRSGQPTCLMMCDLDNFKDINDIHGHEVGNLILAHVSSLLRKAIRRLDIPCRYGGEEFAVVLPNTTLQQGIKFADRLRQVLENSPLRTSELVLDNQASFGVDVYARGDQLSEKGFVERVDGYLYLAKEQGRNRVCHPDPVPD